MPFVSLKDLLPRAVKQAGLHASVGAAAVVDAAGTALRRVCPPEQAAFIHPSAFVEGTLRVAVSAPSAAHALRVLGAQWIRETNRAVGKEVVKRITVGRKGF